MANLGHVSGIEKYQGLSSAEAARRLKEEGYNELPSGKKKTLIDIIFEVMREPMFIILVFCASIYFFMGITGLEPDAMQDGSILLVFVLFVIGITIYQEQKVERALDALKNMASPRALAIRDGNAIMIPGREVVRGDYIVLSEGDRIPADGHMASSVNFRVDESLLTGESVPVSKIAIEGPDVPKHKPGGDNQPFVYASTMAVSGHGVAIIDSVGANTEVGKIGKFLGKGESDRAPLQKQTDRMVKYFAAVSMFVCVVFALIYIGSTGEVLEGLLSALSLAMSLLPEEIPVILTIFFALGAWRLSRHSVLARKMNAIEALGSATVLCVDKTGTLTQNKMRVSTLYSGGEGFVLDKDTISLPESQHELVEFAILASQRNPFDPMEHAIHELGKGSFMDVSHIHDDWELVHEYELSRELLALSHVWQSPKGDELVVASKGAPEAIFDLCKMPGKQQAKFKLEVEKMAKKGLRVIGVASSSIKKGALPKSQRAFSFRFVGLLGFVDPLRPSVKDAVKICHDAGIRVVMITGDYPITAKNIALDAGIIQGSEIITGEELNSMDGDELRARIANSNIFARVVPEQKLKIVEALKANGEIVAMTGDGVNDAPALKNAHIGIAMGARGTEVAREAAGLVLLDDDFSSIVRGVQMGRRIFDNIHKAMAYVFSIHVPIAGLALFPVLLGWPILFFPVHIAFLELVIDPVCSVVYEMEPEEKGIMKRKPRRANSPLFGKKDIAISVLQGIVVLACVLAVFPYSQNLGYTDEQTRALAFTTFIIANLALIATNRSWSRTILETFEVKNPSMGYIFGGVSLLLLAILFVPFLSDMFKFGPIAISDLLICIVFGLASVLWFEGVKVFGRLSKRESGSRNQLG